MSNVGFLLCALARVIAIIPSAIFVVSALWSANEHMMPMI